MESTIPLDISQDKIAELCRRYAIRRLSLFGSVLRKSFNDKSDVDVLVEFESHAAHSLFDLVHLQDELTVVFGRKVDLVEREGLRNPFRRAEILRTAQVIFGT